MMRKVKFQEGGNVEMTAAERRRQNIQRINERRAANRAQAASNAEDARFNERMRQGTLTAEDMRRMGGRSDIERFSERAQRGQLTADDMRRMGAEPAPRFRMDATSPEARAIIERQIQESREGQPRQTPSQSMRDAVRPVAPGTPPRSPAESMRQAVRPVTPSGSGMRAPGIAGLLGAGVALGGAALDAYRNRRPSGPYEQGMEPEGTPEATMPEAERNPPMPQVSGRSYDIGEGGTLQPAPTPRSSAPARPAARPAPRPAPRASSAADDLNAIVLKLQRGEAPANETERRLADRMGIAYRKGGMVKKYRDGGNVTDSSWDEETNRRQIELGRLYDTPGMSSRGRGKVQLMEQSLPGIMHPEDTKTGAKQRALREELRQALDRGEDVEIFMDRLVRRNPQRKSFKTQEYKKGGMVKPKTAMKKGGAVKPKAPATKMKAGGKVAPKKMMKGGMTSKPKKMMGGGKAMYAKGGMAKGCK